MAWETEFTGTTPDGRRVVYETRAMIGYSHAERPDRVWVNGHPVHTGWVGDHQGYAIYHAYVTTGRGIDHV